MNNTPLYKIDELIQAITMLASIEKKLEVDLKDISNHEVEQLVKKLNSDQHDIRIALDTILRRYEIFYKPST